MNKKSLILPFLVVISIAFTECLSNKKQSKNTKVEANENEKPNIIFYLADDQDVYDYGCYGNEKVNTTAVDRLAKEGMLFTNAFTAQAICAPSRSQVFTGNYPVKNGCFANHTATRPHIESVLLE